MSKRLYREFYLLPRGEQRGLILLSLLLILSLVFRIVVQLLPDRVPEGIEAFEQEASLIRAAFAEADSLQGVHRDSVRQNRASSLNVATPYTFTAKTGHSSQPIDINRADSAQLLPLPGIGPVFASRMIKYRDLLGGFASVDQLKEVYGISLETIERITDRIVIDTTVLIKLDLNSATFRELLRHPYLEYEDVKAMVNYRDFKGNIQSFQELQENYILPDSVMKKVIPYLYLSNSEAVPLVDSPSPMTDFPARGSSQLRSLSSQLNRCLCTGKNGQRQKQRHKQGQQQVLFKHDYVLKTGQECLQQVTI